MHPLYLFLYLRDGKVVWASARPEKELIINSSHRYYYYEMRNSQEQIFTTLYFDSSEEVEAARAPLSKVLRYRFNVASTREHRHFNKTFSKLGKLHAKAIILPEANIDLCWPNRSAPTDYFNK